MQASTQVRTVRRWWWLLATAAVVAGAVAYMASSQLTPVYHSTVTLMVAQQESPDAVQRGDIETSQMLADTFAQVMTVRPILEEVIAINNLGISVTELRERIDIDHPASSQLLEITAEANDAGQAADIANSMANVFIQSEQVQLASRDGVVTVLEPAEAAGAPTSPRPALNAIIGALLGIVATGFAVTMYEYRDDRLRTRTDVAEASGLPVLGQLRDFGRALDPEQRLRGAIQPRSATAEEYRAARTNLGIALDADDFGHFRRKVVLFTSPGRDEGKSTTVANIAVMFGNAGYRVLLVDGDLHRPTLHAMFGLENDEGLSTMLAHGVEKVTQETRYSNISLIASGPYATNISEVLGSAWIRSILLQLREQYDIILVDSPPVCQHADALALATLSDAVVVVTRSGHTRASTLSDALDELSIARRPMVGTLLNRTRGSRFRRQVTKGDAPAASRQLDAPRERVTHATAEAPADRLGGLRDHLGRVVHPPAEAERATSARWFEPLSTDRAASGGQDHRPRTAATSRPTTGRGAHEATAAPEM